MGLEAAIEFIADDELIEITPKNIRLRKRILNTETRLKAQAKLKKWWQGWTGSPGPAYVFLNAMIFFANFSLGIANQNFAWYNIKAMEA